MIKKIMRLLLILCSFFSLLSCSSSEPLYHTQSYVFGTLVDISIYGEQNSQAQAISATILRDFQDLHNRLHAWKPSEINSINRHIAQGNLSNVNQEVVNMIQEATKYSVQSEGLFNPAIGNLIQLWGFQSDEIKASAIDTQKMSDLVNANPQMTDLQIQGKSITSLNPSVRLDLGGYVKGYALDKAMAILEKQGVKNALINIGGNVIALGKHGEKPWRVGIQHPRKPNAIAALDLPSGWAIGTSGDYQRYFILDGKRYCHILDPRTGMPVQGTQSVTVLIPPQKNAGTLSDVSSKPIFVADAANKARVAKLMNIQELMIIEESGDIWISPNMQARIEWLEADAKAHLKILP